MKCSGNVYSGTRNICSEFGVNPEYHLDPGIKKNIIALISNV